jgi:hypothetical protein
MTELRQIIADLETSKKYMLKAQVIDKNLGVLVGESVAILETPADVSIPGGIPAGFLLFSSAKSVMFRFDTPSDPDISGYDFEVYETDDLNGTLLVADVAYQTVFTVVVDPSPVQPEDVEAPRYYYGRVRAFDTTGNRGPWTSLVKSQPTLIDSAEINSLTASKIKAGNITSSIIQLDGAASVIRSTNYVSGTSGWRIQGDGTAEFSAGVIRGTVKAGSVFIDANNRWKSDASGATIDVPEFNVGSSTNYVKWDGSTLTVKGIIRLPDDSVPVNQDGATAAADTLIKSSGFVGGLTLTNEKLFFGQGNFADQNTAFYVGKNASNQADFSLGDKLTWNGSTLTVRGDLKLADGSSAINEDDADEAAEEAAEEAVEGLKDEIYEDGFIGGLTINATKMFFGQGTFNNENTAFYVGKNASNQADFSLGDKLTWNGEDLTIKGNINATSGTIRGTTIDIGNGNFKVTSDGEITTTSGKLGPYSITSEGISQVEGIRSVKIHPVVGTSSEPVLSVAVGDFVSKVSAGGFSLESGGGANSSLGAGGVSTSGTVSASGFISTYSKFLGKEIDTQGFSTGFTVNSDTGILYTASNLGADTFGLAFGWKNSNGRLLFIVNNDSNVRRFH